MDPTSTGRPGRDPGMLLAAARGGDRAALGRLLSIVERGGAPARELGRMTFAAGAVGDQVVGITGAPGAGKSTLTDRMIEEARKEGGSVAVLAIDPSSPSSGGAILGDRIRMQRHVLDSNVFVRSMATRGHLGGLALAAPEAVRTMVAVGFPLVIVETVGVGQVEVEVAGAADSTVVVVNPGWGDAVQVSKAGLLEVADVFVVNKADRPGAVQTRRDLDNMLDMTLDRRDWRPPIVMTTASSGEGAAELWEQIRAHRAYLLTSGELDRRRHRRLTEELHRVLMASIDLLVRRMESGRAYDEAVAALLAGNRDPYATADALLAAAGGGT